MKRKTMYCPKCGRRTHHRKVGRVYKCLDCGNIRTEITDEGDKNGK